MNGGGGTRITILDCQVHDNSAQQVDTEPGQPLHDIIVQRCYLDGGSRSTDYALTISGAGKTAHSVGFVVHGNKISGAVFCVWAEGVLFTNNNVSCPTASPPLEIYRSCADVVVQGNRLESPASSGAHHVVKVSGTATGDLPRDIVIADNVLLASSPNMEGINLSTVVSARV